LKPTQSFSGTNQAFTPQRIKQKMLGIVVSYYSSSLTLEKTPVVAAEEFVRKWFYEQIV
jgi:hypothetical protein